MQRSRRTVLAALPVALAGCGRSFRRNSVPGGLSIQNELPRSVTVTVSAAQLPPTQTAASQETLSPRPETPIAEQVDPADVSGEYEVAANKQRAVPDFFPEPGRWAMEAVVDDGTDGDGGLGRARIELHAALPGPTGADSVEISITADGVTATASSVD
jgi:hypothetical protein